MTVPRLRVINGKQKLVLRFCTRSEPDWQGDVQIFIDCSCGKHDRQISICR